MGWTQWPWRSPPTWWFCENQLTLCTSYFLVLQVYKVARFGNGFTAALPPLTCSKTENSTFRTPLSDQLLHLFSLVAFLWLFVKLLPSGDAHLSTAMQRGRPLWSATPSNSQSKGFGSLDSSEIGRKRKIRSLACPWPSKSANSAVCAVSTVTVHYSQWNGLESTLLWDLRSNTTLNVTSEK